ncbi:sigma 54-interacting transcriptional regulator [Myxococcota bacterium]
MLRVETGPDAGLELELPNGMATVGKSSSCDLRLSDSTVSAQHLRVSVVEAGLEVSDLGSTNGTYYLETRLQRAVLPHGAVVTLGGTRLALVSRPAPDGVGYSNRTSYGAILGSTPAMRGLYSLLERIEQVDYPVLISGQTGVGKELVAREVHARSSRKEGPFEICDCGSVPANLAESELFGHARGAFTGAHTSYRGTFERADTGTVFLDEIGELPLDLQPKLLRVLETRQIRPLGSGKLRSVDVRVVAATNRDLAVEVRSNRFREDLYYRLNVVSLEVPPLCGRREDIPELVRHFVRELGKGDLDLAPETLELFTSGYHWPGNIRELRNAVARVLSTGLLPSDMEQPAGSAVVSTSLTEETEDGEDGSFREAKKRIVDAFERDYLLTQLRRSDDNISQAARAAGIDRNYFKKLLRKHGLHRQD